MLQDANDEHLPSKQSKGRSDFSTSIDKRLTNRNFGSHGGEQKGSR